MKKLHLLCNSHIDPVWLWRWNEGLAETLSTFRVAADFCEQYDGFIFNHNESLLYEWIEEHDPSRIDLENLNAFAAPADLEVVHSTAEDYMADIDRSKLKVHAGALAPCMVGCYTSMVRIKQANRRLENKIALTEKAMSYAKMQTGADFDEAKLKEAKKALAFCQFHDILPGSAVKIVEEDSLRTFHHGEEIVDRLYTKAFFQLCQGQPRAEDGTIPVLIFNPHPFEIEGEFELEFLLQNQNHTDDETTLATVYDTNGTPLPTQNETPQSTLTLDWVKKICFRAKIAPSCVSRFDCQLTTVKISQQPIPAYPADYIEVSNEHMTARISKKTGLIETYEVDGKALITDSGRLEVYRDDEDSYGSEVSSFLDLEDCFTLMDDEEVLTMWIWANGIFPSVSPPIPRLSGRLIFTMKLLSYCPSSLQEKGRRQTAALSQ